MDGSNRKRTTLEEHLNSYHDKLSKKSQNEKEIANLKAKISIIQSEQEKLSVQMADDENVVQIEIYEAYRHKDLLRMATYIEKHAKQEVLNDFRCLTNKFKDHNLQINDITSLQRYVKIYGPYVREEHKLLRGIFGAFGGKLDD